MARSEGGASLQRAATKERRSQPPLLPRARRVGLLLALVGVARLAEIAADIGTAFAPWPTPKATATRPTPVFQQSPRVKDLISDGREHLQRIPFVPFVVRTSDGHEIARSRLLLKLAVWRGCDAPNPVID